jgi:hypothetical protein
MENQSARPRTFIHNRRRILSAPVTKLAAYSKLPREKQRQMVQLFTRGFTAERAAIVVGVSRTTSQQWFSNIRRRLYELGLYPNPYELVETLSHKGLGVLGRIVIQTVEMHLGKRRGVPLNQVHLHAAEITYLKYALALQQSMLVTSSDILRHALDHEDLVLALIKVTSPINQEISERAREKGRDLVAHSAVRFRPDLLDRDDVQEWAKASWDHGLHDHVPWRISARS